MKTKIKSLMMLISIVALFVVCPKSNNAQTCFTAASGSYSENTAYSGSSSVVNTGNDTWYDFSGWTMEADVWDGNNPRIFWDDDNGHSCKG